MEGRKGPLRSSKENTGHSKKRRESLEREGKSGEGRKTWTKHQVPRMPDDPRLQVAPVWKMPQSILLQNRMPKESMAPTQNTVSLRWTPNQEGNLASIMQKILKKSLLRPQLQQQQNGQKSPTESPTEMTGNKKKILQENKQTNKEKT